MSDLTHINSVVAAMNKSSNDVADGLKRINALNTASSPSVLSGISKINPALKGAAIGGVVALGAAYLLRERRPNDADLSASSSTPGKWTSYVEARRATSENNISR